MLVSQRSEALPQEAKFSKNGFINIRDTDWEGVDPVAMRDRIKTMEIVTLKQDLTFFLGLSNAALIPFAVPFPELCFEVGQLWQKGDRVLKDIKGDAIMDFSPEAIKEAFQWISEGSFEYTEADSLACYRNTKKATITIKS